ncbi:MAG: superinfection immunity protein [Bacteroidota bacterium]|jgi:high-affinity K+ transport system ATPase subunit B
MHNINSWVTYHNIVLYLMPSIVAMASRKKHRTEILLVNLLMGWTIILWFHCLIWSIFGDYEEV